jgi:hypothetical protein
MTTKRPLPAINLIMVFTLVVSWMVWIPAGQARAQGGPEEDPASALKEQILTRGQRAPAASPEPHITSNGIVNGDFESGPTGWTEFSLNGWPLIVDSFPSIITPRSGSWLAWLGGDEDEVSYIEQQVTLPAGDTNLTYWHWIGSADSNCAHDFGGVLINGAVVDVYSLCDAENTHGWVQHTVDLSAYAGQAVTLQIRAETDSADTSSLFIDDVALGGQSYIYLPIVGRDMCSGPYYFDDFSNPGSGWYVGEDDTRALGYLNGEYQILVKHEQNGWVVTPDLVLPANYRVQVDARSVSSVPLSYGLMFGMRWTSTSYEGHQVIIYPSSQEYLLNKRNMDGSWQILLDWTYSSAINTDASNHLRVDRKGNQIHLYINDVQVTTYTDGSFTSAGRDAGIRAYSYDSVPVDVRFDNFAAQCLP